jgi:sec-independent protein translocase protein TatA
LSNNIYNPCEDIPDNIYGEVGIVFNIGTSELLIILILALIVLGPGKLPEVGHALGKALKEFKKAIKDVRDDVERDERKI